LDRLIRRRKGFIYASANQFLITTLIIQRQSSRSAIMRQMRPTISSTWNVVIVRGGTAKGEGHGVT
jgi:hypothetical protein